MKTVEQEDREECVWIICCIIVGLVVLFALLFALLGADRELDRQDKASAADRMRVYCQDDHANETLCASPVNVQR